MVLRVVASSCLLALAASAAVAQTPSLGFRYDFPANSGPRAIISADFNRDGFPDLALSGTGRDSIMVLFHRGLENGEGQRFRGGEEIVVGGAPFDLAVGDLNRDGWPDIAVANSDLDAVTLLLGGANGVFRPKVDIPMVGSPRGIALADMNRDGALDIVVTRYSRGRVTIMSGRGDGTFDPIGRSFQTTGSPQGVAVGDIDIDGWPDMIVAGVNGAVNIFSMKPGGVVRADWGLGQPGGWNVVTTGDFNKDGLLDVAAASTSGSVVGVFTNGGGNLAFSYSGPIGVASSPRGIEAADLNQDGRLEILTAGRSSSAVSVLSRGADGAYAVTNTAAGSGARDVTLADFNGDGLPDVATANEYGNSTSILDNTVQLIAPGYAFDPLVMAPQYDSRAYAATDFNHNGKMDIVRNSSVLLDGTTSSRQLVTAGGGLTNGGAAGDFNGDGHPDVVYSSWNAVYVFWGDGKGGFLDGPVTRTGWFPYQLRAADMNRDGRLDIVAEVSPNNVGDNEAVEIYRGDGAGHFIVSHHRDVGRITWLLVDDVDRDGALDMIVSSDLGVSVMTGDGRGGQKGTVPFGSGTPRYGIALGDLNHDGALDLVVANGEHGSYGPRLTSRITVALGKGDGSFEELDTYDVGNPDEYELNATVVLGDLNHDGFLDVMTGNGVVLPGSSNGRLGELQRFGAFSWHEAIITDVTGDGLNDVVGFATKLDFEPIIMRNTRRTPAENRAPVGVNLPERGERNYAAFFESDDQYRIPAGPVYDPDVHALRYRWTTGDGRVVGTYPYLYPNLGTGTHQVTLTIDDYRGKSVSDRMEYTITPHKEIVMHAFDPRINGSWTLVADSTAASNTRAWNPNANAPKVTTPLAVPPNYIELVFIADPTQEYKLWIRLKAEGDHWENDSLYAQFSGASDGAGNTYAIGTTSALRLNLEECSGCGISGWGWEDDGWGAVNKNGVTLRFPEGGFQRIRLQPREDGVSFDQIVLSAETYKTVRPGTAKNDTTRLGARGIPD